MNWQNLRKNKCPKCNKDFAKSLETYGGVYFHGCGFKISEEKFKEIVSSQNTKAVEKQQEYVKQD